MLMRQIFKFSILCFLLGCKDLKNHSIPSSYKIYCWSFFSCNDTVPPFSLTSTQINVNVSEIIQDKYLIINDSSSAKSLLLYNLLLKGKSELKESKIETHPDARFALLINYKEEKSDTLVYYNDSSFCLNNKLLIHYNFKVLDSLKANINVKCFECKYP